MQTIPFSSKLATLEISVCRTSYYIVKSCKSVEKESELDSIASKSTWVTKAFSALMYESSSNSSAALSQRKIGSTQSIRVLPLLTNLGAYSVLPTLHLFTSKFTVVKLPIVIVGNTAWNKLAMQESKKNTVKKFENFSITQFLCEINFDLG